MSERPAASEDGISLEARPVSLRSGGARGVAVMTYGAVIAAGLAVSRHGGGRLVVIILVAAVFLLLGAFAVVLRPRYALFTDKGKLWYRRRGRAKPVLGLGERGRVIEVNARIGKGSSSHISQMWLLINAHDKVVVRLNRKAWDARELEALRNALGLSLTLTTEVQSAETIRARYPGVLPRWVEHPQLAAAASALLLIAALVAVVKLA